MTFLMFRFLCIVCAASAAHGNSRSVTTAAEPGGVRKVARNNQPSEASAANGGPVRKWRRYAEVGAASFQLRASSFGEPIDGQACGKLQERELQHGGHNRSYSIYRPCQKAPRAVFLSLQCYGCTPEMQATRFIPYAEQYGFVLLAPKGVGDSFNAKYCCGTALEQKVDDRGFIKAITQGERGDEQLPIYAYGFSNGGFMASDLAMAYPGWLSGAAIAAGHTYEGLDKLRGMPMMLLWQDRDKVVRYKGCCGTLAGRQLGTENCCCGINKRSPFECVGTPDIFLAWQRANHCKADAVPLHLTETPASNTSLKLIPRSQVMTPGIEKYMALTAEEGSNSLAAEDGDEEFEEDLRGDSDCMEGTGCSKTTVLCTYKGKHHELWAEPPEFLTRRVAEFFNGLLAL